MIYWHSSWPCESIVHSGSGNVYHSNFRKILYNVLYGKYENGWFYQGYYPNFHFLKSKISELADKIPGKHAQLWNDQKHHAKP